jgi:hypothetical protein
MLNVTLNNLYLPLDHKDWVILECSRGIYELRMGGMRKVDSFNQLKYSMLPLGKKNKVIVEVFTDNENLLFVMSDGSCIVHGYDGYIDFEEPNVLDIVFFEDTDFKKVDFW